MVKKLRMEFYKLLEIDQVNNSKFSMGVPTEFLLKQQLILLLIPLEKALRDTSLQTPATWNDNKNT